MGEKTKKRTTTYRFSDKFISVTTTILITVMLVMIAAGFILGFVSDSLDSDAADVASSVAIWLIIGGIALPLLIAAVLGGEAIRAGGGIIGFLLIVGLFATVAGSTEMGQDALGPVWSSWAFWGGITMMALAVLGFFVIGWIAKVPMWLQAPVIGSPRVYVRGSSDSATDAVLPNKLDGRKKRAGTR
ncbi:hypothetical protein [Leifsonia poae]|uniref:hypothetical protein n=1 Tax=Leifsonia poae TaxID=110933 RepID=UPI003D677DDF